MLLDKSSVYTYKEFYVYQARDENGNLAGKLVCIKGKTRLELHISPGETISNTVHAIEAAVDKFLKG